MTLTFKVLSLFDGISCGMIALEKAGIPVESYDAYEIDKYAIEVSHDNYPQINHKGNVFDAVYQGKYDLLIGGSPCVYWSLARTGKYNNGIKRETKPEGYGWELFSQYLRALREVKPKYFLYENNVSMSKSLFSILAMRVLLVNFADACVKIT